MFDLIAIRDELIVRSKDPCAVGLDEARRCSGIVQYLDFGASYRISVGAETLPATTLSCCTP